MASSLGSRSRNESCNFKSSRSPRNQIHKKTEAGTSPTENAISFISYHAFGYCRLLPYNCAVSRLSAYALATQCPVLKWRILLPGYFTIIAVFETYVALEVSSYPYPMRCPVLS
eukprot:2090831-Rhodomonas_salina.1